MNPVAARPSVPRAGRNAARFVALAALAALVSSAAAGTIWTLDGKSYEGDARLDAESLVITPKSGQPVRVPLKNLLFATIGTPRLPAEKAAGKLPGQLRSAQIPGEKSQSIASFFEGTFTLKGNGTEANPASDNFAYTYQNFNGDGTLTARIVDITPPAKAVIAKAGLMFRSTSEPTATFASILVSPTGDAEFRARPRDRELAVLGGVKKNLRLPVWVRLTRTRDGKDFIGEVSADGRTWDEVGRTGPTARAENKPAPRTRPGAPALAPAPAGRSAIPSIPMGFLAYGGLALVGGTGQQPTLATLDAVSFRESRGQGFKSDTVAPIALVNTPIERVGRGILLKSGSYFANTTVSAADGRRLRFRFFENDLAAPLAQVARVTIEPLSAGQAERIPPGKMGILNRNGDFMEGEVSSVDRDQATLSSVVFGLTKFELTNGTTSAIVMREPAPADAAYRVLLTDGSVMLASAITTERDRMVFDEPTLGKVRVGLNDVFVVRASAAAATALSTLKASKVDGPGNTDPAAVSLFDRNQWTWLVLAGGPSPTGIISPAGAALTYDINAEYRTLVTRIGIPERVPARAAARFVVLADEKEVFRSKTLTSKDAAVTINVPVAGARTLTLRIETDPAVELSAFGAWGDPMLVK